MTKILYVGNKLKNKKSNISSIHTLGALLETEGFDLYYSSSKTNKIFRLLDMIWSCMTLSKKVDFVLIDTYSTLNFYYAYIISQLCRLFNLKYIPILHGGNLSSRLSQNPKLAHHIFNHSYKIISPSLYLIAEFSKHGYDDVTYIPNSIEIDKYMFKERDDFSPNLLWVRSFSKIYNPSLAVQTLSDLNELGCPSKLCMVGPDSDGSMQSVKQLAKTLNVDVTFTGKLTKEAWIDLSKDYDVFINTTNFDNMPVSVIEAMALGLLVVSTNVGGLPYLITNDKDGLLVPPNNSSDFANTIKKSINNTSKMKEITLSARKKVETFDWQVVKLKWKQVLQ